MPKIALITAAAFSVGFCNFATAEAVDASSYMNHALATKPNISTSEVRSRQPTHDELQKCLFVGPHPGPFVLPNPQCFQPVRETVQVLKPATVTNSYVQKVSNLVFDQVHLTSLPTSGILSKKRLQNCGDATLTDTVSLSVSGTRGWSVTKTNSVTTVNGASATGSVSFIAGGSVTMNWSQTISTSTAAAESKSDTVTKSITDTLNLPAKTAMDAELFAFQASATIPFHADIVVDGDVIANNSSVTKASQLMSEAERTLPFDGTLNIDDVSDSTFRTIPLTGANGCAVGKATQVAAVQEVKLPPPQAAAYAAQQFNKTSIKSTLVAKRITVPAAFLADDGPTIGAHSDGTTYTVLYSIEVALPDAGDCGFNDLSIPNPGIYRRESRTYETWQNNHLVSQEQKDVDTFVRCQAI